MNIIFRASVKQNKVHLQDVDKYNDYLKGLEGKDVEVIVRKPEYKRSNKQNKYYWSVIVKILSDELGYEREEMHEVLKYQFLKMHKKGFDFVRSTSSLNTIEMEKYHEDIRRWSAQEQNIMIPEPNEVEI
jgi:hypothetical protein